MSSTVCSENGLTPSWALARTARASTSADWCGGREEVGVSSTIGLFHHGLQLGGPGTGEAVADIADRADERLPLGTELGPQPPDVHIHRAGAAVVVHPPHLLEQLLARHHSAAVLHEVLEQLELLEGQVQRTATRADRPAVLVDHHVGHADRAPGIVVTPDRCGAPGDDPAQPGLDLRRPGAGE